MTHRSTLAGFPRRWTRFRGVLLPQPRPSPTLSATATRSAIATTVATPLTTGLRMTTTGRPATSRLASHRVIILPTVTATQPATQIAPTAPTVLTAPTATKALAVVNRCVSITALCRMRTGQVLVQSNSTRCGLTLARALQSSNDDETNN